MYSYIQCSWTLQYNNIIFILIVGLLTGIIALLLVVTTLSVLYNCYCRKKCWLTGNGHVFKNPGAVMDNQNGDRFNSLSEANNNINRWENLSTHQLVCIDNSCMKFYNCEHNNARVKDEQLSTFMLFFKINIFTEKNFKIRCIRDKLHSEHHSVLNLARSQSGQRWDRWWVLWWGVQGSSEFFYSISLQKTGQFSDNF